LPALELPAGQAVQLKPGGYHLMLMDLKQPLPKGATVPLTLRFQDAKGLESKLEIKVPVSAVAPAAMAGKPTAQTDGKAEDHGAHKH
jgi:copper(I)-binding protein